MIYFHSQHEFRSVAKVSAFPEINPQNGTTKYLVLRIPAKPLRKPRQKISPSIAQFTKFCPKFSTQIPPCYCLIPHSTDQIIFNTIYFKNRIIQLTNFHILKASLLLLIKLATVSLLLHCSSCFLLVFFLYKKK